MKRPIVINIHSLIDKVVVNGSSKEEVENLEKQVTEALLRALKSANDVSPKDSLFTKTLGVNTVLDIIFKKERLEEDLNAIKEHYTANPDARVAGRLFMFTTKETGDSAT